MKRVVSLCTGYGGLDMAVRDVWPDARTFIHAEIEPSASKLLAARHPGVPNIGDVTTVDWARHPIAHRCHILTAGYPCQPFSNAGKKKGFDDARNIWPGVLRAIRTLRPRLVVLENVRHHLRLGFDRVLGDLAEAGFDAEWGVLRASDIGASHQRARLFIVAWPTDTTGAGLEGPEPAEGHELSAGGAAATRQGVKLLPTPAAMNPNDGEPVERWEARRLTLKAKHNNGNGAGTPLSIAVRRDVKPFPTVDWGPYADAVNRWTSIFGRPAPVPHDGKHIHPSFVEWMMGLPDGWVTDLPISRSAQLRMLGNGVVPQQAAAAIRWLLA